VALVEHPFNPNTYSIHIKKGTFKDVVYCYGKVSFKEEGDNLRLCFETTVIENPRKHDIKSKKFTKLTGNILEYHLQQCASGNGVMDTEYVEGQDVQVIEDC
jgi:hypothetical protein